MIVFNRKSLELSKNDDRCKFCQKCIAEKTKERNAFFSRITQGIQECPYGYSTYATDSSIYCGVLCKGYFSEKKVNGHRKFSKINEDLSILSIDDLILLIEYNDLNVSKKELLSQEKYDTYANTIHNIKNTIRTISEVTGTVKYFDDYEVETKNYRNLLDGIDLIRTILDYHDARVYGDRIISCSDYIKPHKMILKLKKLLETEAKRKKIKFKFDGDPQIHIFNDSKRMYLIFFILLENAIKYSLNNSQISIMFEDLDYRSTSVIIKNTTECITNAEIKHIFERGYRCGNSENHNGSGFGMEILYNLLKSTDTKCEIYLEDGDELLFCAKIIASSKDDF